MVPVTSTRVQCSAGGSRRHTPTRVNISSSSDGMTRHGLILATPSRPPSHRSAQPRRPHRLAGCTTASQMSEREPGQQAGVDRLTPQVRFGYRCPSPGSANGLLMWCQGVRGVSSSAPIVKDGSGRIKPAARAFGVSGLTHPPPSMRPLGRRGRGQADPDLVALAGAVALQAADNLAVCVSNCVTTASYRCTLPKTSTDGVPLATCGYAQVRAPPPLFRDEEVALALWRAGRRDGWLAMPSHGPLTSTLTTTRCHRVGRARTTPDR